MPLQSLLESGGRKVVGQLRAVIGTLKTQCNLKQVQSAIGTLTLLSSCVCLTAVPLA